MTLQVIPVIFWYILPLSYVHLKILYDNVQYRVNFLLDTGASTNILSSHIRIKPETESKSEIKSFDGTIKKLNVGSIHADVITNRKDEILDKNTKFIITELEYEGILGMPTLNNFDIKLYDQSISLINNE